MLVSLIQLVISFISILSQLISFAMFAYALMSWFATGRTPLGDMLARIVEPLCRPFKWARWGMIDFSFLVAYLLISFGSDLVIKYLYVLAASL